MTTRGLCISLACLSLIAGLSAGTSAATTASTSTTALFFVEMEQDGVDSVEGLDGAHSVAVSPDGKHVYATGNGDNAVVVFSRDSATGEITYVETHEDGTGGVDGLEGAHSVAITPDGHHVYVTGDEDHAVAAFDRNETTGRLTHLSTIWDSDPGVDGLYGASSVAVSPDGNHVYVTGYGDDAVVVLDRNPSTGELSFNEMQTNGAFVSGLWGAISVAISPDGKHVYVAGKEDDAVAIFSRDSTTGKLTYFSTIWDSDPAVDGWYVHLQRGVVGHEFIVQAYYVWPVRGGQ